MAINTVNLYLANSKYTYSLDNKPYCGWFADMFDITKRKEDIMYDLLDQINEWNNGLIYQKWLVAVFNTHESNNEDYNYFDIFEYVNWYSNEDYKNKWKTYWFGFIENRVV